jgi:hypothetical protein
MCSGTGSIGRAYPCDAGQSQRRLFLPQMLCNLQEDVDRISSLPLRGEVGCLCSWRGAPSVGAAGLRAQQGQQRKFLMKHEARSTTRQWMSGCLLTCEAPASPRSSRTRKTGACLRLFNSQFETNSPRPPIADRRRPCFDLRSVRWN